MSEQLDNLIEKADELIQETMETGLSAWQLIDFKKKLNKLKQQCNCEHDLTGVPYKTHGAEGLIWKCVKCEKVIDVETAD